MLPRLLLAILLAFGPSASGHAGGDRCRCSAESEPVAAGPSCCDVAPDVPADQCSGCGCSSEPSAPEDGDEGCGDDCRCGCLVPADSGQIPAITAVISTVGVERAGPVPAPIALCLVRPLEAMAAMRPASGFTDPGPPRSGRRRLVLDAVLRL